MLYHGDMRAVLADWSAASVDACVTDPPYELGFMGKAWDATGIAFQPETWAAVRRVLKPGGHLVAFGGTRTWHRLACAIEDAGFELRDTLCWLHGQGFPKSLDVSKALDKAAGAERAVVGVDTIGGGGASGGYMEGWEADGKSGIPRTAPVSDLAREWSGWGTGLKPAMEPVVLARAPLSEPTVAANVARWGTGGLNVDGCRIGTNWTTDPTRRGWQGGNSQTVGVCGNFGNIGKRVAQPHVAGRWPPNVTLSHTLWCNGVCAPDCPVALLDAQSGATRSHDPRKRDGTRSQRVGCDGWGRPWKHGTQRAEDHMGYADQGGASRFYYVAKASPSERNAGLPTGERNGHPTVKPVALCRWLVRLVTPPGGLVCDPFMGSGSIGVAAREEGMAYWGVEQHAPYLETAQQRIGGGA